MQLALILSGGTEVDENSLILDENLYDESFGAGLDGIAPAVSQEQLTELGQSDGSEDSAAQAEPEDPLSGLSESERILRSQKLP